MSTNVAASLFLQRLLHEKYMEDSRVDSLIQAIIRGTGTSFSSKASFIEHTNKLLSEIGFILVRVIVSGKRFYSLKDLDSTSLSIDAFSQFGEKDNTFSQELNDEDFRTPTRTLADKLNQTSDFTDNFSSSAYPYKSFLRLNLSKFTHSELMIFIDSINCIIQTGKPLALRKHTLNDSWSSLCSKRSIVDEPSQMNLFERFERRKWLEFYSDDNYIAPGVRFYFDLSNFFDLRNLNYCDSCSTHIIFNEFNCQECKKLFHPECASSNRPVNNEELTKCFTCSIT